MSLQNICAMLWNFALFDTIFSVVDIPSFCILELCHNQDGMDKQSIIRFLYVPNPELGTVCLGLRWKE